MSSAMRYVIAAPQGAFAGIPDAMAVATYFIAGALQSGVAATCLYAMLDVDRPVMTVSPMLLQGIIAAMTMINAPMMHVPRPATSIIAPMLPLPGADTCNIPCLFDNTDVLLTFRRRCS